MGEQIFENLPKDIRTDWAGLILSHSDNYIEKILKKLLLVQGVRKMIIQLKKKERE